MPHTPFIAQMEAAECGAACLAMVLAHFGHHAPLSEVRRACEVSRDGTSASALVRAAQSYGLVATAHRVELDDLAAVLPAILHWELNHYVVLRKVSKAGLHVLDPASGARLVSLGQADDAFTGVRLSFEPGPQFRSRSAAAWGIGRYCNWGQTLPALGLLAIATLVLEVLGMFFPVLSQVVIDFVVRPQQERFLLPLALVLISAASLRALVGVARARVMAGLRNALNVWLMRRFMEYMLRLPLTFFRQRSAGELVSRVEGHAVLRDVIRNLSTTAFDALLVVSYTLTMLVYSPLLALVPILTNLCRVSLMVVVQMMTRNAATTEIVAAGRECGVIAEAFGAPEVVKAFGMEAGVEERYVDAMTSRLNASGRREEIRRGVINLLPLLDGLGLALTYWIGAKLVATDELTLGVLAAFTAMSALLGEPLSSLVGSAASLPELRQVLARLDDIWQTPRERATGQPAGALAGGVALTGVTVRYGSAVILSDIDLEIEPGERVAIVGPSGSGKSTLLQVLGCLLEPAAGEIWFDGVPCSGLALDSVRAQIASVPPEVLPLAASARENIAPGQADQPLTELRAAARLALIDEEVGALPDGYDTLLSSNGAPLSGGQNQRLGLARALLRSPRLLLLDEATSSLDVALEQRILQNLRELSSTQVLVTHRPAAMRHATRVVVMNEGRIVDQGSLSELNRRCAIVRELLRADQEATL